MMTKNSRHTGKYTHAIIGCGRVAPNHVVGIRSAKHDILICCDLDENKARQFAKTHNIKNITTDYKDILQNPAIQSVSICTDHASHAQIAIDTLNHGKNVIVEKPIALSLKDGQKMIDTSLKNKRILSVISQHRYNPVMKKILTYIRDGVFGDITMISGSLNSYKDKEYYTESNWRGKLSKEGGSTLINQAIHTLDLMVWIMDKPDLIKSKMATLKFKNIIETEDTIVSLFEFKNGALGSLSSTNTSVRFWDSKIELIGTKGLISFKTGFPFVVTDLELDDKKLQNKIKNELDKIASKKEDPPPTLDYFGISHKYQIKNFIDTIEGKSKLEMEPSEALRTLEAVLGIYKNA